ncbi:MAG: TRAP transporter permease [Firmicutes bacterium]|nr:TRAP transporter permease [Bacillota bacterium]
MSLFNKKKEHPPTETERHGEMVTLEGSEIQIDAESEAAKVLVDKRRVLVGKTLLAVNIICFAMALFQLYAAGIHTYAANIMRPIHLGFGMCIVFLIYPFCKKSSKKKIAWYDLILAGASTVVNGYLVIFNEELANRAGQVTMVDFIMGLLLILLLLEAARRVVGPVLVGVATFFIVYALFGNYFPMAISHGGVSINNLVRHMYLTTEGIYGTALGVSASFIFLFILMGAILSHMGTGEFLIDMAICAFGKMRGGPAKAAVVSSALFGLVNGSAVANIATTGTFTIPLMKKVGYKPHFAGSTEAAASIGGQIMPPVMGAAAFIIAENLGVSYISVCAAAALPAVLYFTGIFFAVHQEAVRMDIKGMKEEDLPNIKEVLKRVYLVLPLIGIIVMLIIGFSPAMAGFIAVLLAIALSWIKPESRLTPKKLFFAFADGARNALEVLIACAVVGFIVGSFTLSGLGLKLAALVVDLGGGVLIITLLLTALASLILGMGVPTTANYVMMAMITVPAVTAMGVLPMAAHLFCFYFGIISDLTPPVALGALAGSGIAGAKFWPTAVNATKLGIAAYVGPFFFVYNPILLLGQQSFSWEMLIVIPCTIIGIMVLSCGLYGFVIMKATWYERILCIVAGFLFVWPNLLGSAIGVACYLVVYMGQRAKRRRQEQKLSA